MQATSPLVEHTLTTNAQLAALDLSFYSLSKLADALRCVDPRTCLEQRLARENAVAGVLTLDRLGNFISFSTLGARAKASIDRVAADEASRRVFAARQCNIDVAQRELDRRNAEGEDVSHLRVDQRTAAIVEAADEPESQYAADLPGFQDFAPQYR